MTECTNSQSHYIVCPNCNRAVWSFEGNLPFIHEKGLCKGDKLEGQQVLEFYDS